MGELEAREEGVRETYTFFAMMARLKFIDRWQLMRNAREENLSEHSLETAMIAHALAVIGNRRFGKKIDAEKCALFGMYHDVQEILTGDMPTPVKYYNPKISSVYKEIETVASEQLISLLPEDMREDYRGILEPDDEYAYEKRLVKGADKISAYIKCLEEKAAGNNEFRSAETATRKAIEALGLEEADVFMAEFLPAYTKTLDELQQ